MKRDIAIIGLAGRFPEASDISGFLENLIAGRDSVRQVSEQRRADCDLPPENFQIFGHLEDVDKFDYNFFGIAKGEAVLMDPHHRLLLEVVYEAIENSAYPLHHFGHKKTGIFVSCPPSTYERYLGESTAISRVGNLQGMAAGRMSRFFDLKGNSLLVDTTCSSSLVAVSLACRELYLGEAEMMIVCAGQLILFPEKAGNDNDASIMSRSGKAKAFSADADGTGSGEAFACVILKPLEAALRDKDRIHAVIKGEAINQDASRSSFLTAPSKIAQSEVIREAWIKSGIDPATIGYIEAHGTGTIIGDPIELEGVNSAFRSFTNAQAFCALGSVKSNIGHTNFCAGLGGMVKAVLCVKHNVIPPTLHVTKPNPLFNFDDAAIYINTQLKQWDNHEFPRRAGVSSFGISGTNCHIVIEEAPANPLPDFRDGKMPYVFCFSSKTADGLTANIEALSAGLSGYQDSQIENISYTLSVGRQHYNYRYAVIADDLTTLTGALDTARSADFCSVNPNGTRTIALFSEQTSLPDPYLAVVSQNERYQSLMKEYGKHLGTNAHAVLVQYCIFYMMLDHGLTCSDLYGLGIGEITVSIILKEMSLAEGLAKANSGEFASSRESFGKIIDYVKQESSKQTIAVFEVGHGSQWLSNGVDAIPPEVSGSFSAFNYADRTVNPLLRHLSIAYQKGVDIHWKRYFSDRTLTRVDLPSYRFSKSSCWPGQKALPWIDGNVEQWMFSLGWEPQLSKNSNEISAEHFLIVADADGLWSDIVKALQEQGNQCTVLHLGERFLKISQDRVEIDRNSVTDYFRFKDGLSETPPLSGIIYLANFRGNPSDPFCDDFSNVLFPAFHLFKAFASSLEKNGFYVSAIVTNGFKVHDDESVDLEASAVAGFLRSLYADHPTIKFNLADFDAGWPTVTIAGKAVQELTGENPIKFVAYRNKERFVGVVKKASLFKVEAKDVETKDEANAPVYVIAGGASGIGFEIAKHKAATEKCSLVIIGQTKLPSRESWKKEAVAGEGVASRINNLLALESLGAEVIYYDGDIANDAQLKEIFADLRKRHLKITGGFHSAGVNGKQKSLRDLDYESFQNTLSPKVNGTINLYRYLSEFNPAYFVINSSLNALVPQKNTIDYTSANAFADAFASRYTSAKINCISISWPGWAETGMSYRNSGATGNKGESFLSISSVNGIRALEHALSLKRWNSIVANVDLSLFRVNPYFLVPEVNGKTQTAETDISGKAEQPQKTNTNPGNVRESVETIWKEVLQMETILPGDDFFSMGGHSLLAAQVMNRLEKTLGIAVEFEDFLDHPTLAEFLNLVDAKDGKTKERLQQIVPVPDMGLFDLSHGQKRIWFLSQVDDTQFAYNMAGGYYYHADLDPKILENALKFLMVRYEILRTTVHASDGELKQKIHPVDNFPFFFVYMDSSLDENGESNARILVEEDSRTSFDFATGPLLRLRLIRIKEGTNIISLSMHHIISDGWSMEIFIQELTAVYIAMEDGQAIALPELKIQYRDFVAWQQEQLQGNFLEHHENYWLKIFSILPPPLTFLNDFERPARKTFNGDNLIFSLDKVSMESLNALAREEGCSIFMTLLATIKTFIFLCSKVNDIVIGTPISGRYHKDLEDQVGLFLNTLALRTQIMEGETFTQFLTSVRKTCLDAFEHQVYPFDVLVEKLPLHRNVSRSPLFDIMVMHQKKYRNRSSTADVPQQESLISSMGVAAPLSKYDLTFNFTEAEDVLHMNIEYNTDIFKAETIQLMANRINNLLGEIIKNPGRQMEEYQVRIDFADNVFPSAMDVNFNF